MKNLKKKNEIEDFIAYQLKQRKPLYRLARHKIIVKDKPAKVAASEILKKINDNRETFIKVRSDKRDYSIRLGKNLLSNTDTWLPQLMDRLDSQKCLLIFDKKLKKVMTLF